MSDTLIGAAIKAAGATHLDVGYAGILIQDWEPTPEDRCLQDLCGWYGGPIICCLTIKPENVGKFLQQKIYAIGVEQGQRMIRKQLDNILRPE